MDEQKYCISARSRRSGTTMDITGPLSHDSALAWQPNKLNKAAYVYFRVSKYPFKDHKKGGY